MSLLARAFAFGIHFAKQHRKIVLPVFAIVALGILGVVLPVDAATFSTRSIDVSAWTAITNPIDMLMVLLAALFNAIASGVGWMIITLIKVILIPILNYDGFATSRIIGLGWSLVRDVVNMFVVIILLVIAILTIVGSPKANWEQQIPRLFIYVIAVNFSRTICGLALDIGNVIMFQFVNAILDVGAGNFAQLLKLNITGSFSELEGEATKAFQLLAQAYLQLALLLAVLAVIGIMALVFIYRIVVLWVLIILSPAAFFLGGIKDVLGQAGSAYSEWWKKFSSAIILGPMLTFFLWLALAAASTGDIVTSENFPTGDVETTDGLLLKTFDMSQITGLMLGLVLLVVGMQQAAGAAGALGGVAAQFINEGMGMRIAKGALRLPARELGRQADRRLSPVKGSTFSKELGAGLISSGQSLRASGVPIVGAVAGRGLAEIGSKLQGVGNAQIHDAHHNAEERVKGWDDDRLASELELAAGGDTSRLLSNSDAQNFAMKRLVTEKQLQDNLEAKMIKTHGAEEGGKKFEEVMRNSISQVEAHEEHIIGSDEGAGKSFNATKTRFVHLIGEMAGADGKMKTAAQRQRAHLDNDKTDLRQLSENAIKNEGVRANLGTLISRTEADGTVVSKLDDVEAGKFGTKLSDQAIDAPKPSTPGKDAAVYTDPGTRAGTITAKTEEELRVDITGGALQIGGTTPLTTTDFGPMRAPQSRKVAKAIALSGRDFTQASNQFADPVTQAHFKGSIDLVIADPTTTKEEKRKALAAQYLLSKNATTGAYDDSGLIFSGPDKGDHIAALQQILKKDPTALGKFSATKLGTEEVQDAIERSVTANMMTKLRTEYGKLKPSETAERKRYADAITAIHTALEASASRPGRKVPDGVKSKERMARSIKSEL